MSESIRFRHRIVLATLLTCFGLNFLSVLCFAHDPKITSVEVKFDRGFQSYSIAFHVDLDALSCGFPAGHLNEFQRQQLWDLPAEEQDARTEELKGLIAKRVHLRFDEQLVRPTVELPERGQPKPEYIEHPYWGHLALLTGSVPTEAKLFTFEPSKSFGSMTLTILVEGQEATHTEILAPGAVSQPFALHQIVQGTSSWFVVRQYVWLGFEHILPKGLDHILFVLGLYLLSPRWRSLLWQVSAFTLAHTITLALSMYGVVRLSPSIVEPLIALSIAYVAIENTLTSKLRAWRPVIVFLFGLLHGLGFAGVLMELGIPQQRYAAALVSFNAGVELGQLAVIGIAFAATAWFRSREWYRARIVVPASVAIALVGFYWAIERTLG